MTLLQPALLTDGGTHPSRLFRRFAQSASLGNEGIDFGGDFKVKQTTTASTGILVGAGGAFVKGKASALQGTYYVSNPEDHSVANAVPSVGTTQHYLVVLRVEDPAYEGAKSPNTDMNSIVVMSTTIGGTTLAAGVTGIVLARLEVPANTTTITSAMIVDLRKLANPRRQRWQSVVNVPSLVQVTSSTFVTLINGGSSPVPDWASLAYMRVDVGGLVLRTAVSNGGLRGAVGSVVTQETAITDEAGRRSTIFAAGLLTIPSNIRGTSQTVLAQFRRSSGTGTWEVDTSSTGLFDIEYVEGVV